MPLREIQSPPRQVLDKVIVHRCFFQESHGKDGGRQLGMICAICDESGIEGCGCLLRCGVAAYIALVRIVESLCRLDQRLALQFVPGLHQGLSSHFDLSCTA